MPSDAMRDRLRKAFADEFYRQPLPSLRWQALSEWRQMLPALVPRAQRHVPAPDIWLAALLNELSRRFDLPLEVSEDGPVRRITALDFVRYSIDRRARTVTSAMLVKDAPVNVESADFDVVCPWQRLGWLPLLLGELPAMRVAEMLMPESRKAALRKWLGSVLGPMLRRDERFRRLRRELREALCFDPVLFRLALRTRPTDTRIGLTGKRLQEVWRHEAHLRIAEKDAPRVLPLVYSMRWVLADGVPPAETVKQVKGVLAVRCGLTDAGWRYLLKYGVKPMSVIAGGWLDADDVARLAQALAMAGGHAPPSSALCRAIRPRFGPMMDFGEAYENSVVTWLKAEPRLAGTILRAANEAKGKPDYPCFADDVAAVLWWLRDSKTTTPKKSLRTLFRLAREWEADQFAVAQTGRRRWSRPRSLPCPDGIHEAVLLDEPAAVLEEARAMRNCLLSRMPALSARREQIWSVRNKESGQRVALVGLQRDSDRWVRGEIAARFNRPAPAWVTAFAEALVVCENLGTEAKGAKR